MPALAEIKKLIERFDQQCEAYLSGHYNETQLRREFVDPFFKGLGWDVDNVHGYAEAYKDVIHEDAIKIGGATKAPDYCFRIGGTRKFFVETKKPSVNIKDDVSAAFQLRRYAWSAKLPLSILTDFEEFAAYDCRIKPAKNDKASVARILYFTYRDYMEQWDEIASIFSREAILKGSFDKYAETSRLKRGTAEVDGAFLQEIESWREMLARNLALRNPDLSQRELNFAVQRIIDRIIFLRICEDRGVEDYGRLQSLMNGTNVYARLCESFYRADERYNSGLFYFEPEKERVEEVDRLTPRLMIDDKLLKDIITGLYYPESPYEFSVLPADILGQVYEQFLGKVIRLTAGHRAIIEDKPEVKKAGGIYYTPTYIVDYIVKKTVGALLEEKTPKQAAKLRILDPACGSGSFLIAAYQYLLDWHRDRYLAYGAGKHRKELYQGPAGDWRLATAERKRILLNNIFGVDLDSQAVEVTKLSLLLKVLEGESEQTLIRQLKLFHQRALPDLGKNIKCGNSLIDSDFYGPEQMSLTGDADRYRANIFDWEKEFPETIKAGGFDAVIGNPPYGAELGKAQESYLRNAFETATRDLDTYALFIEKALGLAKVGGKVSMIIPTGWYSGVKFGSLRRLIACQSDPEYLINLPYDVFKAWVDTTVIVLIKRSASLTWPRRTSCKVLLRTFPKRYRVRTIAEFDQNLQTVDFAEWFKEGTDEYLPYSSSAVTRIIRKIENSGVPLQELADVQRGVTPFELTPSPTHATSRIAFAGTIRRYRLEKGPRRYIRFDETLAEPKPERYFIGLRLLLRELISRQFQLQAVKVVENFVTNKSMQSILQRPGAPDLNYILGILNSRLMSWYFLQRSSIAQRDDFPKIVLKETRSLPIAVASPGSKEHGQMVKLVDRMLSFQKQLQVAKTPDETTQMKRQIQATDQQVDEMVYGLYGLTEEEIEVVEGPALMPSLSK